MRWGWSLICCLSTVWGTACASLHVVSVPSAHAAGHEQAFTAPLTVVVDTASVRLPVVVTGSNVAYADVERALEDAVFSATAPVVRRRFDGRRFELFVELVEARAEYSGGRLVVDLTTRDTLRDRNGNTYLAQTHARSRTARSLSPELGSGEVVTVADAIGAELAGWLLGVEVRPGSG